MGATCCLKAQSRLYSRVQLRIFCSSIIVYTTVVVLTAAHNRGRSLTCLSPRNSASATRTTFLRTTYSWHLAQRTSIRPKENYCTSPYSGSNLQHDPVEETQCV